MLRVRSTRLGLLLLSTVGLSAPALAQRTGENAVTSAEDAFGTSVGNETIGLYSTDEVRGFSPAAAGNIRIDGLYLGGIVIGNQRIQSGSNVRVGLSAQGFPLPSPDRNRRVVVASGRKRTRPVGRALCRAKSAWHRPRWATSSQRDAE